MTAEHETPAVDGAAGEDEVEWTRAECELRDAADPFAPARDAFRMPHGLIYLDGNSLGPLPAATEGRVAAAVVEEWGQGLIGSWNSAGWIDLPQRVGAKIASLVGAAADEVVAADSTSVNLFKVLAAAVRLRPGRRTILSERGNFPTDLYMAQGLVALLGDGYRLELVERDAVTQALVDPRASDVAVVMLTHVDYRSGARLDMADVTRRAHAAGALMLWDLAHSAGAFDVDLAGAGADFAVGCGYKYLNGGPGAPAFLFVARQHQARFAQPLSGWMGHARPFAFDVEYQPADGVARYLCGTPSVLALTALDAGLDTLLAALPAGGGLAGLKAKADRLTDCFIACIEEDCAGFGLELVTPRDPALRGCQVSFSLPDGDQAYAVVQALIERGVVGDFRAPNILRFGFPPIYLRHVDAWDAAEQLAEVLQTREWQQTRFLRRQAVT